MRKIFFIISIFFLKFSTFNPIVAAENSIYKKIDISKFLKINTDNFNLDNVMFLDFETININEYTFDTLPYVENINKPEIFMIGFVYKSKKSKYKWQYKCIYCKEYTKKEEKRVLEEFVDFWKYLGKPMIYFWSAETAIWDRCKRNNNYDFMNKIDSTVWKDLKKVFEVNEIVIKGCKSFSVKDITKSMNINGFLTLKYDTDCSNGYDAMIYAYNYYKKNNKNRTVKDQEIFQDIIKYNKIDCKILYELVMFLKTCQNS